MVTVGLAGLPHLRPRTADAARLKEDDGVVGGEPLEPFAPHSGPSIKLAGQQTADQEQATAQRTCRSPAQEVRRPWIAARAEVHPRVLGDRGVSAVGRRQAPVAAQLAFEGDDPGYSRFIKWEDGKKPGGKPGGGKGGGKKK